MAEQTDDPDRAAERRASLHRAADAGAARLAEREAISSAIGSTDAGLLDRIQALGFDGESARVLDLLPLVHVCWADGRVQRGERDAVLQILERRGLGSGSQPRLFIEALLERRPSESFLGQALALVKDLAARRPGVPADLVDLSARVAEASGGLLGIGTRTSDAERALIRTIADALGPEAVERYRVRFGG
ncbi:MAG: TerB family tellurite resistance protein [Deltaproteobacteria bacterium]|nr:TerB family tellurite resistance protein [Deltaproteobacteria bacterium]